MGLLRTSIHLKNHCAAKTPSSIVLSHQDTRARAQLISEGSLCMTKRLWAVLPHSETQVNNLTLETTEVATILWFIKTTAVHLHKMHLININIKVARSQICIKRKKFSVALDNSKFSHLFLWCIKFNPKGKSPILALSLKQENTKAGSVYINSLQQGMYI